MSVPEVNAMSLLSAYESETNSDTPVLNCRKYCGLYFQRFNVEMVDLNVRIQIRFVKTDVSRPCNRWAV